MGVLLLRLILLTLYPTLCVHSIFKILSLEPIDKEREIVVTQEYVANWVSRDYSLISNSDLNKYEIRMGSG